MKIHPDAFTDNLSSIKNTILACRYKSVDMLETIQIITLIQGILLLVVFFYRKKEYKPVNFKLMVACILSILLYSIGDDNFNLFIKEANWYFFHDVLFISFFYLFIKYYVSGKKVFEKNDILYFIPYLTYVTSQILEDILSPENQFYLKLLILSVATVMLAYLIKMIGRVLKSTQNKWLLYFIIPYTIIYILDRLSDLIGEGNDTFPFFESYAVIGLSAFLFYVLVFKLILSPKTILPMLEETKYKKSNLTEKTIDKYKKEILILFEEEKIFKNSKINIQDIANSMNIPRQYVTELLNAHMDTSFQDMINQYRIEEFINCLKNTKYSNYTLMGIAEEVGFSSKTTFNNAFKKLKGMTPSEYRKKMITSKNQN